MKCVEYLTEYSRCMRGIPVARLFRHYLCEGNHEGCPLKKLEKMKKRRLGNWPGNSLIVKGEV